MTYWPTRMQPLTSILQRKEAFERNPTGYTKAAHNSAAGEVVSLTTQWYFSIQ